MTILPLLEKMLAASASQAAANDAKYDDFEEWQEAVKSAHPEYAKRMQFKGRVEHGHDTVSAEVRGLERSFGVWTGDDDGEGLVFKEA